MKKAAGGDATMSLKELLFSFRGRIGRQTFWIATLSLSLLVTLLGAAFQIGFDAIVPFDLQYRLPAPPIMFLGTIGLLAAWSVLAVQAKRWHDIGKSAWWMLVNLVPAAGPVVVFVMCGLLPGSEDTNRFGDSTTSLKRSGVPHAGT
jgi:uncharacterized membrane protein YhaH (DUF805 family)